MKFHHWITRQISTIIQGHNIPTDQADRWAEFCGGSPMAAHAIAQNLLNNPEHLLRSPGTVNIWERYIVGRADQNSAKKLKKATSASTPLPSLSGSVMNDHL